MTPNLPWPFLFTWTEKSEVLSQPPMSLPQHGTRQACRLTYGRPRGHRETCRGAGSWLPIRLPLFTSCVVLARRRHPAEPWFPHL